jgi:dihydroorotase
LTYNFVDGLEEALIPPPDTAIVHAILRTAARYGGLIAAHCENRELVLEAERELAHPIASYADLLAVHSEATEATAIAIALELVRSTGARFHVVHLSSARGADLVRGARRDGLLVSAETCPQYLTLSDESYPTVGAHMKVYPPIRSRQHQEELWRAVNDGTIDIIASDHAPHTVQQKRLAIAQQPAGIIGTETLGPLMIDAMLAGRLSPARLLWTLAEGPARVFRLHPRKGTIAVGSQADLTLVDPTGTWRVNGDQLHSKNRLSPWEGRTLRGRVDAVVLAGKIVVRDGAYVGAPQGRFVPATSISSSASLA